MRKLVLSMFVSLDGYIEGPGKTMAVPPDTPDLRRHWIADNLSRAGILLYGRVSYQGMADFWMSPEAPKGEAKKLAALPKVVFSRTLENAAWQNTLVARDPATEIARLKEEEGKDIVLFGGAGIARFFLAHRLVDEYRLLVTPWLLGGGTRLFAEEHSRYDLTLLDAIRLDNDAMLLHYRDERRT
jgi:dihydrofolate reductase